MAVVLDVDMFGPFWNKFKLEVCDPDDDARIKAGTEHLDKLELDFLVETKGKVSPLHFGAKERKWSADFVPHKLRLDKEHELPDFVYSYPGGSNKVSHSSLVSARLKGVIENFAGSTDAWQFFPVEIQNPDGSLYSTFFIWWVNKVLDAIDKTSEGVKSVSGPIDGNHRWTYQGKMSPERLKVSKAVVDGINAWTDFRFQAAFNIFVSDDLFSEMVLQEMTGFTAQSRWSEV